MATAFASAPSSDRFFAGIDSSDLAALLLRVSMGVLFLAHAGLKLFVFTPAGTAGYFASLGCPARSPIS
jgi:putative oxidoreductase